MAAASPTILLVDDDEPTRRILRRWLTHLGVRAHVVEAPDGQQALALVEAHCHSPEHSLGLLVILDLNMPIMDGLEFLEHHVQLPPGCRAGTAVIVLSGGMPDAVYHVRVRALATDIQLKPLDIHGLAALVRQHLPTALPS
ncbi:response regulator (plasmid) [Hymenobacter tibetensis]|uniref:Response regulator n=1 Tax=Hymenobacter tibetensis TaxID=497967 RepID=A0ABY4D6J2_9BACT|nr:response regulator [Hymenobacter tibetensis]UOG77667.1 response regulator [Hymenobacter tibetensis]